MSTKPPSSLVRALTVLFLTLNAQHAGALPSNLMRAHFFDVGQGNTTLLEFSCGVVVIDVGSGKPANKQDPVTHIVDVLNSRQDLNHTIATVFVTHTHVDHNSGLRGLVEDSGLVIQNYVHNGIYDGSGRFGARFMRDHANDEGRSIEMQAVSDSDITRLGHRRGLTNRAIDALRCAGHDPEITVLSGRMEANPGWPAAEFKNGNNHSLVIRVRFGDASFLFTGDLEEDAIETLVDYYSGTNALDVDVYHLGHHGSHNGTTESLVAAMTPNIVIGSMGPPTVRADYSAWAYGHPRRSVIEQFLDLPSIRRLSRYRTVRVADGAKDFTNLELNRGVYTTAWDGTIIVQASADGAYVVRRSQ